MVNSKAVFMSVTNATIVIDPITQEVLTNMEFDITAATTDVPHQVIPAEALMRPTDSSATIRQKMIDAIKAVVLSQLGVILATQDIIMPTLTIGAGTAVSETRSDDFVVAGNGETVDVSLTPLKTFSLNVTGINGISTADRNTILTQANLAGYEPIN